MTDTTTTLMAAPGWRNDLALCQELIRSRLLPASVKTAPDALVILLTGKELGLGPMQSLRSIHVIEGRPTLSADLMSALARRSPACAELRCLETTNERATFLARRLSEAEGTSLTFTMEDARRAGIAGKTNWQKWPAAMLRARALAAIVRLVFPDALAGIYDPDEITIPAESDAEVLADDGAPDGPPAWVPPTSRLLVSETGTPASAEAEIQSSEMPFGPVAELPASTRAATERRFRVDIETAGDVAATDAIATAIRAAVDQKELDADARERLLGAFRAKRLDLHKSAAAAVVAPATPAWGVEE